MARPHLFQFGQFGFNRQLLGKQIRGTPDQGAGHTCQNLAKLGSPWGEGRPGVGPPRGEGRPGVGPPRGEGRGPPPPGGGAAREWGRPRPGGGWGEGGEEGV